MSNLVYFEEHHTLEEAGRREKRLKNWCRQWKLNLIEKKNLDGMICTENYYNNALDPADKPRDVEGWGVN